MCISVGWIHSTRSNRLLSILILSSHLFVCVIKVISLFQVFLSQPCMLIYFLSHVTWPAHHTHLSWMNLIMFDEEGTLRNSALCNFFHPCHFLLLRPKYFPQYPVPKHLSLKEKVSPSYFLMLLFSVYGLLYLLSVHSSNFHVICIFSSLTVCNFTRIYYRCKRARASACLSVSASVVF